jgi:hypothetical protein
VNFISPHWFGYGFNASNKKIDVDWLLDQACSCLKTCIIAMLLNQNLLVRYRGGCCLLTRVAGDDGDSSEAKIDCSGNEL